MKTLPQAATRAQEILNPHPSVVDPSRCLTPLDWFQLVHGRHQAGVGFAIDGQFKARCVVSHDQAREQVFDLEHEVDTYATMNGFDGEYRRGENVAALTSLFVDLDKYNIPEFADATPHDVYAAIQEREPWLPPPTMLVDSGRGAYLVWCLSESLSRDRLEEWSKVERDLVELLSPYGADQAAKDAPRILRVPGTVNGKNNATVEAYQVGDLLSFDRVKAAILAESGNRSTTRTAAANVYPLNPPPLVEYDAMVDADHAPRQPGIVGWTPPKLWFERLSDLEVLAAHRSPMPDCRWRMWELYCVGLSWVEPNPAERFKRAKVFARKYFSDADHYIRHMSKVHAVLVPTATKRHRRTDQTILRSLEISTEERRLFATIGQGRNTRPEPQDSREEIEARTAARRKRALRLKGEGYSLRKIGNILGVCKTQVANYLSQSEQPSTSLLYSQRAGGLSPSLLPVGGSDHCLEQPTTAGPAPAPLPAPLVHDLPLAALSSSSGARKPTQFTTPPVSMYGTLYAVPSWRDSLWDSPWSPPPLHPCSRAPNMLPLVV